MTFASMTLQQLRARLDALDHQLLTLIAERQTLSREVGELKRSVGRATRDFQREREVLTQARAAAQGLGISPELAESVLRLLIRGSLTTQERMRVASGARGSGRSALVIGGGGKMGRWFVEFLASQGYQVTVADPAASGSEVPWDTAEYLADWRTGNVDQDLIVVATPLAVANQILQELAARQPRGVIFDIGSLKTPLREGIGALQRAGCRVTSLHPMFGPDTELLSGRHVIFIDVGCAEALAEVRALFAPTMAEQVTMGLDEHDRLIAYVLGLSHALNIAFFTALAGSGEAAPRLAQLSSTTYDAQVAVATRVADDNPYLYFEIQNLNDYGRESLQALRAAVEQIWQAVIAGDAERFAALMHQGRTYLGQRVRAD
jgi:chorismate mutase/prephenate dehydrogenase